MTWLTECPTEPGRYWVKQYQQKRIVHLWRGGTDKSLSTKEDGCASVEWLEDPMYDGALWWSEPIVEPE